VWLGSFWISHPIGSIAVGNHLREADQSPAVGKLNRGPGRMAPKRRPRGFEVEASIQRSSARQIRAVAFPETAELTFRKTCLHTDSLKVAPDVLHLYATTLQ